MGKSSQSTQSKAPWKRQRKYLKEIYASAQEAFGQPLEYFPDSTVAPRSAKMQAGIESQFQLGQEGSQVAREARGYSGDVLSGRYLDPASNPNLQKTFEAASARMTEGFQRGAMPLSLTASGMGRSLGGSSRSNRNRFLGDSLARGQADLSANIFGGAYQTERGMMEAARAGAPGLQASEYADRQAMMGAGAQEEMLSQRQLDDMVARHEFEQGEPWQRLGLYSGMIGAPVEGRVTTSTKSPWSAFGLVG